MQKRSLSALFALLSLASPIYAEPLKIAGNPIELVLSQITDRTVRLDILPLDAAGKPLPPPPSTILEKFLPPPAEKFRLRDITGEQSYTLNAGLTLLVKNNPLTLSLRKQPPTTLIQELTINDADGSIVFHTDTPTFGLGEGRQQFDRRGFFYDFRNGQNALLTTHGATIPIPFLIGAEASGRAAANNIAGGWGMFIHNPPPANSMRPNDPWGQFDLRGDNLPPPPAAGGRGGAAVSTTPPDQLPTRGRFIPRPDTLNQAPTSIFLMNLNAGDAAITEYTHLVGHPVMPPKWVLGYQQSHRSLAGPDEILAIAKKFRDDQLPCDALIYLGTGYTNATQPNLPFGGWNLGHGSLEFNPFVFPNPQQAIDALHALNFKIVLHKNQTPGEPLRNLHGNSIDEIPENPTDPLHISNYWKAHTPLVKMGIDGWWPDDGDDLPVEGRLARIRAYYEGSLKDRPNERPWSLNRNGYAGVAKYSGWNWSGDVQSRWATLAAHVPLGLQFSLSCSPWWGTDIGGFFSAPSNEYTGELYVRWFQFGAFNPLFRSHGRNWYLHTPFGWNTGEINPIESRPLPPDSELHNAEVEPICKKYLELRYQLLPYNYTITREACDTGLPLMRALMLAYPHDPTAVSLGDEYLWGPNILVAPVLEKGATTRKVYLPSAPGSAGGSPTAGANATVSIGGWYDYWTGQKVPGTNPQWITRPVDLATIPLYIKAGSIIPMDPIRQYTAQNVAEPTTLHIYPGANGEFTLYDDDGHSQAYLANADPSTQWIKFTWNDAAKKLSIDPDPRMKQWPATLTRPFKVQLPGDANTKTINFKGQHAELSL